MESSLFTDYMIWKAIGLVVLVGVVSFFYRLFTGRSIAQARRGKEEDQES